MAQETTRNPCAWRNWCYTAPLPSQTYSQPKLGNRFRLIHVRTRKFCPRWFLPLRAALPPPTLLTSKGEEYEETLRVPCFSRTLHHHSGRFTSTQPGQSQQTS